MTRGVPSVPLVNPLPRVAIRHAIPCEEGRGALFCALTIDDWCLVSQQPSKFTSEAVIEHMGIG